MWWAVLTTTFNLLSLFIYLKYFSRLKEKTFYCKWKIVKMWVAARGNLKIKFSAMKHQKQNYNAIMVLCKFFVFNLNLMKKLKNLKKQTKLVL